jgi:hypothetical protein
LPSRVRFTNSLLVKQPFRKLISLDDSPYR